MLAQRTPLSLFTGLVTAGLLLVGCDPEGSGSSQGSEDMSAGLPDAGSPPDASMARDMATALDMRGMTTPPSADMGADMTRAAPLTYWADIKPIIHRTCEGCHVAGGAGPYELNSYASLKDHIDIAMMSIQRGDMPPWSPDPECRHYQGERLISAQEVSALEQWIEQGMEEGQASDWEEPEGQGSALPAPDIISLQNGPYTPSATRTDDYHCFLMDVTFEQDTYITGTNVLPGNDQIVHHANLFLINPTNAPRVVELQDRDPDAGYSCFGDAGISQTSIVGAWVPGATPIFTPEDTAIVIPKGSRLVLQSHYNTLYTPPAPISSEVHLYTTSTPPSKRARALPLANLTFDVPAGEKESEHAITVTNSSSHDWVVIGTAPHLHLLASKVKVEVLRKDDELADECLVDIPDWDFNWQQEYRFRDDEWVSVRPGDKVRLTCTFDNSPENQPIVDGQRLPPEDVSWGGKTNDEMCLNFLVVLQDYDPAAASAPLCSPFKTCRSECEDPYSVACIFNCATIEQDCGECLIFGAQDCASRYCRSTLRPAIPCLLTCAQGAQAGGDLDACLTQECPQEYEELETCLRPYIEQGLCNQYTEECNVEF